MRHPLTPRNVSICYWIAGEITASEWLREFLDCLEVHDLQPTEYYGVPTPTYSYDASRLSGLFQVWSGRHFLPVEMSGGLIGDQSLLLRGGGSDGWNVSLNWRRHTASSTPGFFFDHLSLQLPSTYMELQKGWSWFRDLSTDLYRMSGVVYGRASDSESPVGARLAEGLPGIFWLNYFGPDYVALIGKERLLAAPGVDGEALPDGGVLLGVGNKPWADISSSYTASVRPRLFHSGYSASSPKWRVSATGESESRAYFNLGIKVDERVRQERDKVFPVAAAVRRHLGEEHFEPAATHVPSIDCTRRLVPGDGIRYSPKQLMKLSAELAQHFCARIGDGVNAVSADLHKVDQWLVHRAEQQGVLTDRELLEMTAYFEQVLLRGNGGQLATRSTSGRGQKALKVVFGHRSVEARFEVVDAWVRGEPLAKRYETIIQRLRRPRHPCDDDYDDED